MEVLGCDSLALSYRVCFVVRRRYDVDALRALRLLEVLSVGEALIINYEASQMQQTPAPVNMAPVASLEARLLTVVAPSLSRLRAA